MERTSPFEILDRRFARLIHPTALVEKLWTGGRWTEGPAYVPAGKYLLWSDIPNDRVLRFDETDGSVSVFQSPAMNQNGHAVDLDGRLVSCEHRGRCVSRIEHDGSHTVLLSHVGGRRLNSPNDVVVKSDGTIWFSDPTYGIDSDYEGDAMPSELDGSHVYRFDPASGVVTTMTHDFVQPNGLAFSPDETRLYIADTGSSHVDDGPRHIRAFDVGRDGRSLGGGAVFATCDVGVFDGFRCDAAGHVWTSAGDGVHCYHPDGTLLGKIRLPEPVANLCFGGPKRNRLFVCATTSLYAVFVNATGARWPDSSA